MAEGKKKEYKRTTCKEKLKELLERAQNVNDGKADYNYYNKISTIILFGSLIGTDNEKVHDIDLCVISDDNRLLMKKFYDDNPEVVYSKFSDIVSQLFAEWNLTKRYIKGRCGIFSIHANVEYSYENVIRVALSGPHIYLMKDYKIIEGAFEQIP